MNSAADINYRALTYREYEDSSDGVLNPPRMLPLPLSNPLLHLNPENPTSPLDGQIFCKFI